jgi:hypothetical protein
MIQGDLWASGKKTSVHVKIGEVGKISTREARAKAKMLLGSIADGVDPRPKPQEPPRSDPTGPGPTLRPGWERYREGHMKRKGMSAGAIENYRDHVERLMADWLDFALSKLGCNPDLVRERHEKLRVLRLVAFFIPRRGSGFFRLTAKADSWSSTRRIGQPLRNGETTFGRPTGKLPRQSASPSSTSTY